MRKFLLSTFSLAVIASTTCCSKKDHNSDKPPADKHTGNLYYRWADEGTLKLDLGSGTKSVILPDDTKQNGFHMSRKQDRFLLLTDIEGDYDNEAFRLQDDKGTLIKEFKVPEGDFSGYVHPQLSYDDAYILATSLLPDNVIVIDIAQNKTYMLHDMEGQKFTDAVWMPDGSVLLSTASALYRSAIPFSNVELVQQFGAEAWSHVTVRPDGKKIAFSKDKHIWMMDLQEKKPAQVSTGSEAIPAAFSPDGKYLLAGIHQFASGGGPWANYYTLCILPADGRQYPVEEGSDDKNISWVKASGSTDPEACSGTVQWLE
ncbi:hypothetical protein [Compostibacter hankyongensis]|uniref:WD40 repeat domain-containing protein n=1 Tax=Compostibacter hankyongensis TaxID=1007089 RepID=A0ABP8FS36_9BACT